jgi:hypothetical protein
MKLDTRTRHRALAAIAAACAALVALPASGNAAVTTLGSTLAKLADTVADHGADVAYWAPTIDGALGTMPSDGQITLVKVKGTVLADPAGRAKPDPQFHVQVLHPVGGGQVRVALSSAPFRVPVGGNPQAVNSYRPVNLCVHRGDYVDFNDIGGFEWRWGNFAGMPFQVFSAASASTTHYFTKSNGTNNGTVWGPAGTLPVELLMQYQLSTGPDAVSHCPGGFKEHAFKGLEVQRQTASVSGGRARLKVKCPFRTFGKCRGVLVVKATLGGRQVTLGGAPFSVNPAWVSSVFVPISGANLGQIRKAGGVSAIVSANAHDDPRADRQAPRGMPVQSKTTTGTVRITG